LSFKNKSLKKNPVFALASFETKDESWTSDVQRFEEPDSSRELRIFSLVNQVIKTKTENKIEIDYFVLPELSLPQKLIIYVAEKLKASGISLIAGISYNHLGRTPHPNSGDLQGYVNNQLIYILNEESNGFTFQFALRQNKSTAAFHEETELWNLSGKRLVSNNIKYLVNHNGFIFSGLICNELLNIDYRQRLRGKIDALIIPEWNKDVGMYNSIVESTSNDLHAFILQVNNRIFGDTRARGPYKNPWERDIARVKGGELDYFVVVTLDIISLRKFQDNHRSPEKPFKPVPTGYIMSNNRKTKRI